MKRPRPDSQHRGDQRVNRLIQRVGVGFLFFLASHGLLLYFLL